MLGDMRGEEMVATCGYDMPKRRMNKHPQHDFTMLFMFGLLRGCVICFGFKYL